MFWDQVNRQRAETVEDGADYPRLTLFQRGVLLLQRWFRWRKTPRAMSICITHEGHASLMRDKHHSWRTSLMKDITHEGHASLMRGITREGHAALLQSPVSVSELLAYALECVWLGSRWAETWQHPVWCGEMVEDHHGPLGHQFTCVSALAGTYLNMCSR